MPTSPTAEEILAVVDALKHKDPDMLDLMRRQYLEDACRHNPYLFGKIFFKNWIYKEYGQIHEYLMNMFYHADPYWALAFPRKHGKSTMKKLFLAHAISYGVFKYIVLTGDTTKKVKKDFMNLKFQLENNKFLTSIFGTYYNPDKWTDEEIITKNTNVHVLIMSRGQSFRGLLDDRAPDYILIDDLEDEDSINTDYTRRKLEDWLLGNVMNAVDQEIGKIRMLGTILHSEAVLMNRMTDPSWRSKRLPCIVLDSKTGAEKPLWPEFYTLDFLHKKRASYFHGKNPKPHIWYHEWMNQAVVTEDRRLNYEKIRYHHLELEVNGEHTFIIIDGDKSGRRQVNTFTAVDLAGSQNKGGDFWVVNTGAIDGSGNIYLLNTIRQRQMKQEPCVQYMFDHQTMFRTKAQFLELIGCQDMIMDTYEMISKKIQKQLNIQMQRSRSGNKDDRIIGVVAPKMNNGMIYCQTGSNDLEDECRQFEPGKESKNDILDTVHDIIKYGWAPESSDANDPEAGVPWQLRKPKQDEASAEPQSFALRALNY